MDIGAKQSFIRQYAEENHANPAGSKILWSRHSIIELVNEDWRRGWVENGLRTCEVIEDYPSGPRPLPDCLVLGWLAPGAPFHAVIAVDQILGRLFVVTVYKPAQEEWQNDWRTRKR